MMVNNKGSLENYWSIVANLLCDPGFDPLSHSRTYHLVINMSRRISTQIEIARAINPKYGIDHYCQRTSPGTI
jgi:hypothetical protein